MNNPNIMLPSMVTKLANLSKEYLANLLAESGYTGVIILNSHFSGINKDGHFVYTTVMPDDSQWGQETVRAMVFVKYDFTNGALSAEF